MAAEWVGKCGCCNKWRNKHDTHRKATRRDIEGNPSGFVIACDFCSTSIQLKCCASGCPLCGGSGMMPRPQPPTIQCEFCENNAETKRGSKFMCFACEGEIIWEVRA